MGIETVAYLAIMAGSTAYSVSSQKQQAKDQIKQNERISNQQRADQQAATLKMDRDAQNAQNAANKAALDAKSQAQMQGQNSMLKSTLKDRQRAYLSGNGIESTILTSGQGDLGLANEQKKKLLGQ
jgi:hypothetical protein